VIPDAGIIDAAIIGGGPAGCAAAISLKRLMPLASIAIFDASRANGWKPGEILSPGARPILESLGCWEAFAACGFLESFGTRSAWGSAAPHDVDFLYSQQGNGWRLDRGRFDRMLRERVRAEEIEVHTDTTLLDSVADGSSWRLKFRGLERVARFVIDASGRSAVFAVHRGSRRLADDRLAAAVVWFESPYRHDTLIEAANHGWWYSASLPDASVVAAFMTDVDLIREYRLHQAHGWQELLRASHQTADQLREASPKGNPAVFTAHSQRIDPMAGSGWAAAGDAAMTFDPLSAKGILKGLRSGKLASFVAADYLLHGKESHSRYQALAMEEYEEYRTAKSAYYAMEHRWGDAPFWKRRR